MIAQNIITNDVVMNSDDATVRAAVKLLTSNQSTMLYRWACETCGMVHTGAMPTSCDSCGADVSLVYQSDFRREINSRW
jgi:rubrerythrin